MMPDEDYPHPLGLYRSRNEKEVNRGTTVTKGTITRKDSGLAFPFVSHGGVSQHQVIESGMSLRDWFAGMTISGMLSDPNYNDPPDKIAELAYKIANALIQVRENIINEEQTNRI